MRPFSGAAESYGNPSEIYDIKVRTGNKNITYHRRDDTLEQPPDLLLTDDGAECMECRAIPSGRRWVLESHLDCEGDQ